MRKPPTTEGEVWLQKYRSAFMRWAKSSYADAPALSEAIAALQTLLERCPDYAAEVEHLASIASFASRRGRVPDLIAKLAQCGLEAGAMATQEGRSPTASAILLLSLAEAELHAERRLAGLDALGRLAKRLDASTPDGPMVHWIKGRMHSLFGELHELGLEEEQARRAYAAAIAEIEPILSDAAKRKAFLKAWGEAISEQPTASAVPDQVALLDLNHLAASSAVGLARAMGERASREDRAEAGRRAWRALEAYGPPPDLSPFDVIPVIGALPPGEALTFGAALVTSIEKRRLQLEKGEVPEGITHPEAIAIVRRAQQNQARRLGQQRAVYEVIGKLGFALAKRADGNLAEAESAAIDAIQAALNTKLGGPQVCAFGLGLEIAAAVDREGAAHLMDAFMMALAATIQSDPGFFALPRIRVLLDGAIATAASIILEQLGDGANAQARRRASAVLDLLRRADPPPAEILMPEGAPKADGQLGNEAALAVEDTLGRIRVALRAREDCVAIVIQCLGPDVLFLVLESDDQPISSFVAGPEYRKASAALADAANEALRAEPANRRKAESAVDEAGRLAFQALPQPVQHAISSHKTVLLAPDFRGRQDTVPFELMHDGTGYLAGSRILGRFTSLAHMAATLDTRTSTPRRWRALVTAAPVAEDYDALDLAPLEQEEVSATLTRCGFDAPTIDPTRLSATFFTDRLAYVDVLHVCAHGESGADMEWLVLPNRNRLVVEDLLRNPQYRVPFVYLNTCNLGQTRYLGAGVSRGLAYSFAELGAPAVVAHTTPVPDKAALRLAVAFYDNAPERSVGEALLDARRALLEDGESAVSLASAIIIGDPDHSIIRTRVRVVPDLASDLLDNYMSSVTDDSSRMAAWTAARNALDEGENPRVEAAMAVVRTMSEVRDLQDPAQAAALDRTIGVSDLLRHLPARAMLRFLKAVHAADEGGDGKAAPLLEDAIRYLVPLAAFEPAWGEFLRTARQKLALLRSSEKGLEIRTHLPAGEEDDGAMRAIMEATMGAQQTVEEAFGAATPRDVEDTIDDILWNAVVMGHPNRFEDAPEAFAFAQQVARKLERGGFLPATAMRHAPAMLAGLLRYLWDSQNLNYLSPDAALAQAGALRALVDEIRTNWSPPEGKPWYELVESAPRLVDELLAFIDGLSWEDVYKHLDPRMDALAHELKAMLDKVQTLHPTALGACAAYVSGLVIAKNTFSPLEGSVPESIGERMTKVSHALDSDNESRFFGLLTKGFETVSNRPIDELTRWRMEPDRATAAPPPKRASKPSTKSRRARKRR